MKSVEMIGDKEESIYHTGYDFTLYNRMNGESRKTRKLSKITLLIVVFAVARGVTFVTNAEDFGLAVKERRKK